MNSVLSANKASVRGFYCLLDKYIYFNLNTLKSGVFIVYFDIVDFRCEKLI